MKPVVKRNGTPWDFLDQYRGKTFSGEWPTLPEMFRITVDRYGTRNCFTIYDPDRISFDYNEALRKIEKLSRALRSRGIKKGDKIALTGKNSPEWAVAYLAILFSNAIVVPIDYQLSNQEIENLIRASKAKFLFVDEEKFEHFHASQPEPVFEVFSLRHGIGSYIYEIDACEINSEPNPETNAETRNETVNEFDTAAILFTSGTMGKPKGVMLSHRNLVSDCYLAQGTPFDVYHTDIFYAILPLHHAYTMLAVFIEAISTGAEVVFGKKMVVQVMLHDLKAAKITMLLGVPMLFNKLLAGILRGLRDKGIAVYGIVRFLMTISGFIKKTFGVNPGKRIFHAILDKASLTTLRTCISGGGPLAPSVFRQYNQLGLDFVQGYGLTETSPIINLNPIEHYKETSVGKVLPHIEEKILDPDESGVGEVAVKGPVVMQGYYEMPEETEKSFTPDGFFKTGDLGYLDSENYLYLTGRAKNVIVTEGGKNVYPEEIENEFQLFDEIDQILVRPYAHDPKNKSEGIEAVVFPSPEFFKNAGAAVKEQIKSRISAIVSEVNARLLPYQKIEKTTILDDPMEMTTTKKIKRKKSDDEE
ncbi:MAG: AMP-binding protein [Spirochaetaceae bacterium]|jgi:long-chain acyl-CoA synthetase|nr:AMP-binding protein [Spirochaetaceae bacterium]